MKGNKKLGFEQLGSRNMMASGDVRVNDVTVDEGDVAAFEVSIENPSSRYGTYVGHRTTNGSAGSGDYSGKSGSLYFAPGESRKIVSISTKEDTRVESTESFNLNLTYTTRGRLADKSGKATILDDDKVIPPTTPPTTPPTGQGPQQGVTAPQGALVVSTVAQGNSAPAGATIFVKAGVNTTEIRPKDNQTWIGEYGAIIRGGSRGLAPTGVNVTVRNFVFENQTPQSEWSGAVHVGQSGKFYQNEIRYSKIAGIVVDYDYSEVKNNFIHHNERLGVKVQDAKNVVLEGNEVSFNNWLHKWDEYNEAGGSKFWNTTNLTAIYNNFHDNDGPGLWADYNNRGGYFAYNKTSNNTRAGIIWEISYDLIAEYNESFNDGDGYPHGDWQGGGGISVENSAGTSTKPIIIRYNTVKESSGGVGVINVADRDGGTRKAAYIQIYRNTFDNTKGSGYSGTRPSNFSFYENLVLNGSYLVGVTQ